MSEKKIKNNTDWKKRVKAEYFRLLQAKKTKKDDDNVLACMNNQKKLYGTYKCRLSIYFIYTLVVHLYMFCTDLLFRQKSGRT